MWVAKLLIGRYSRKPFGEFEPDNRWHPWQNLLVKALGHQIKMPPLETTWLTLDQWQSFVEGHPRSSIFHHRKWLELIHGEYGFEIQIPAIVEGGVIRAAIPLLQARSLRMAKKLISLPFTDYLQLLADDQQVLEMLCHQIGRDFRGRTKTVVLRADEAVWGFACESPSVRHQLNTDLPFDQIESKFASSIKRNLQKGRRCELHFQQRIDEDGIAEFYRLHVKTRRKLGVPVQPLSFFRRLHDYMIKPGLGFVVVVTRQGVPISAGVMLGFNGRLTYKYAASDPNSLEIRPNDWLVYNSIRIASETGYRVFDFGISDKKQEGLRRFKSKWGATESEVFYTYVFGEPENQRDPSQAMRFATELIKRSPSVVCRLLGKAFYKYSQ